MKKLMIVVMLVVIGLCLNIGRVKEEPMCPNGWTDDPLTQQCLLPKE